VIGEEPSSRIGSHTFKTLLEEIEVTLSEPDRMKMCQENFRITM